MKLCPTFLTKIQPRKHKQVHTKDGLQLQQGKNRTIINNAGITGLL